MTTIQEGQAYDAVPRIAHALNRIANVLEAQEQRAREQVPLYPPGVVEQLTKDLFGTAEEIADPDLALQWKLEVINNTTVLGFTEWRVWHESEQATTPEDIENMGEAIAAVKRGFAEMEAQVKGERDV
jgi:hypothetical protein